MRIFDGTLRVETINGRRGPFNVGKLITDIGEFKVKDKELDQFEPGDYLGEFLVEKIYTASNPWRGGVFTEMLAKIAPGGFMISVEESPAADGQGGSQAEPDPLDAEKDAAGTSRATPVSRTAQTATANEPCEEDRALLGLEIYDLFLQGADIALDPTVDREQFRLQRSRLKSFSYQFIAQEQIWKKKAL